MPPRSRSTLLAFAAVLAAMPFMLGGPSSVADETAAGTGSAARADAAAAGGRGQEYVVAYEGDDQAARRRVRAAGGRVVEVLEEVGVVRVRTRDRGFLDDVRDRRGITGAARNHAVGTSRPGVPHRFAEEQPPAADRARVPAQEVPVVSAPSTQAAGRRGQRGQRSVGREVPAAAAPVAEPLADRQWDMQMIGATADGAHQHATGAGVEVGIIDTGIDGDHPDIAPNFDRDRSRNFTVDRPDIDGPCEVESCVDPADADHGGHGTHVAATVAAAANGFGMAGVAPDARLVNLRAGQDSGYFFLYEVAEALVAAGDLGLDVVNMSFYTDPWLYNCAERGDYVNGDVTDEELAQQQLTREVVTEALEYAHDHGVTLIAAAGNGHTDLAAPMRHDETSPDFPAGRARARTVRRSCVDLPAEGPHVVTVGAVGPSGIKSDYSNYGQASIEVSAPGGWLRDRLGTPGHRTPDNLVLAAYPLKVAIDEDLASSNGQPLDGFSVRQCDTSGVCGFYTAMQGTSMAAPHVAGVAALIIQRHGQGAQGTGYQLSPTRVGQILAATATDRPCPTEGTQSYDDVGRSDEWSAVCEGTTAANGLYGEGLVSATAAVAANAADTAPDLPVTSSTTTSDPTPARWAARVPSR